MALELWPDEGAIDVVDVQGNDIATIPIGFLGTSLAGGASMRTWTFVYSLVSNCVSDEGSLMSEQSQIRKESTAAIAPGRYIFVRDGEVSRFRARKRRFCLKDYSSLLRPWSLFCPNILSDDASLACNYIKGPVAKRRGRKVVQAEGSSTVSNSKRSSVGQVCQHAYRLLKQPF